MGNSNTKESRPSDGSEPSYGNRDRRSGAGEASSASADQSRDPGRAPRTRLSRSELGFLTLGGTSSNRDRDRQDAPFERRETRQEREARRLERERAARAKERERSLREEHIDGGYLVTLGTYTGTEDFSKPVVRQLQVSTRGHGSAPATVLHRH
jgi:hypothetical protein